MDKTPWNKLCVDLIGTYNIRMKGRDTLIPKSVTVIDPLTGWFGVTQYNYRKLMMIANLVETTWLSRYPWPLEITYGRGSEFLSREFKIP